MGRLREVVEQQKERMFVGRDTERMQFREWLSEATPEVLQVYGPPGIGKTTLLLAYQRDALALGHPVRFVDGRTLGDGPDRLESALGTPSELATLAEERGMPPLLILDSFEHMGTFISYLLQDFLPVLESTTRVIVAGRGCLFPTWTPHALWIELLRPMHLRGLPRSAALAYIKRRGIESAALAESILTVAGGHPLALSLATSLAVHHVDDDLTHSPEWKMVVHTLVEYFLEDLEGSALRTFVRAGALFDPLSDARGAGAPVVDVADMLDQLCRQSLVESSRKGLFLQEDFSRFLKADLAWQRWGARDLSRMAEESRASLPLSETTTPIRMSATPYLAPQLRWPQVLRGPYATDGDPLRELTPREREVAQLLCRGRTTNRELAETLVISPGTANLHVKHILNKLDFSSRAQLAGWLTRHEPLPASYKRRTALS